MTPSGAPTAQISHGKGNQRRGAGLDRCAFILVCVSTCVSTCVHMGRSPPGLCWALHWGVGEIWELAHGVGSRVVSRAVGLEEWTYRLTTSSPRGRAWVPSRCQGVQSP